LESDKKQSCKIAKNTRGNSIQNLVAAIFITIIAGLLVWGGWAMMNWSTAEVSSRAADVGVEATEQLAITMETVGFYFFWVGWIILALGVIFIIYSLWVMMKAQENVRDYCN